MTIREGYRSLYGDLTKLKDTSLLDNPAAGAGDDDELFQLLLAASEHTDRYCNRHFTPITTTKLFDGNGAPELLVPDLISVTTLKEDDGTAAFGVTWAATDYHLGPYNAEPTKPWGGPYTHILARQDKTHPKFTLGSRYFQIVGKWGYRELTEDSGTTTTNAGYTATVTAINVAAGGGAKLAVGQTILIGTEQLLITEIATDALTVVRGLNGTTAAIIAASLVAISILRPPLPVERATLINAARIWTRAPAFEPFYVDSDLDTDVRALLDGFRRLAV